MTPPESASRLSGGGHAVRNGLIAAGLRPGRGLTLVETAPPRRRPYDVVVSQNAWNFVPPEEYSRLIAPYPVRHRAIHRARRVVARVNTARAATDVTLSDYMGSLLTEERPDVLVASITLPWDLCTPVAVAEGHPHEAALDGLPPLEAPFVLVPGTVTWYKDPARAVDLVAQLPAAERPLLVFAGPDDASGCADDLRRRASQRGVRVWIGPVARATMRWLLSHARATLLTSRLESLSFSMAEALLLSPNVLATALPVHQELSRRMGREPRWLSNDPDDDQGADVWADPVPVAPRDLGVFRAEWVALARALAR